MSVGKRYVLDANVFIGAHQAYYAFDICPAFWQSLIRQHAAKRVVSIDRVRSELVENEDRLSAWVRDTAPETFFKRTADRRVVETYADIMAWVQSQPQYSAAAKAEFAAIADGWVVAYANVNGLIVVTHEEYAPDARRRVLIPNLCVEFDVEYCNTFEMLRDLKVRLASTRRTRKR